MILGKGKIGDFMTAHPHGIEPHQTVQAGRERMNELKVHHLPVRSAGKVVGIVSDKDLTFLEGLLSR